ncbi:MAG TPA: hypothetical protein DEF45_13095 [Rhodopirellula sp.]|nr:hypothetical protein [Rhodopirellula sp.]
MFWRFFAKKAPQIAVFTAILTVVRSMLCLKPPFFYLTRGTPRATKSAPIRCCLRGFERFFWKIGIQHRDQTTHSLPILSWRWLPRKRHPSSANKGTFIVLKTNKTLRPQAILQPF